MLVAVIQLCFSVELQKMAEVILGIFLSAVQFSELISYSVLCDLRFFSNIQGKLKHKSILLKILVMDFFHLGIRKLGEGCQYKNAMIWI